MARITALFLVLIAFASLAAGCGSGESKEDITTEVARTWVETSIDEVSDEVIELIVGEVPVVSQIAGVVLAEQIRDNLAWAYSAPRRAGEDRYRVTVTARVNLGIELPLLGDKAYAVSVPFNLDVDTNTETVVRWSPDVLSATVGEQRE